MNISLSFLLHMHWSYNVLTQLHPSFKPPLVPVSLSTGNDFLKIDSMMLHVPFQRDADQCTINHQETWLPTGCNYCYFLKLEAPLITSIFWVIWGVKPLFVVQKRGNGNPTEIMLGPPGGMKVNCYLKIIYLQLQEWSTHRYN